MDLHQIAAGLAPSNAGVRLRQGTVTAYNADGTIDVTLADTTVTIPDVPLIAGAVPPPAGAGVWLLQQPDGDLLALGALGVMRDVLAETKIYRTTAVDIVHATTTDIAIGTAVEHEYDPLGLLSHNLTAGSITVGVDARVRISANVPWEGSATGARIQIVRKNGSNFVVFGPYTPTVSIVTGYTMAWDGEVDAGDVFTVTVRQTSGANLEVLPRTTPGPDGASLTVAVRALL